MPYYAHSQVMNVERKQEMRWQGLIFVFGFIVVGCGGMAPQGGTASAGPLPPFKPVVDTRLLMEAVVDPNADIVWDSVRTIITAQGAEEITPQTDEQWTAVRNAAVAVAESGNLLMMVPRAKAGDEWMKAAQALAETGQSAIRAIEARNAPELFTAGGNIYGACTDCHSKYVEAIVNAAKE